MDNFWTLEPLLKRVYDMSKCGAMLVLGDDHGDNSCTFVCDHRNGHIGLHQEHNRDFGVTWERYRDDRFAGLYQEARMALYHIKEAREWFKSRGFTEYFWNWPMTSTPGFYFFQEMEGQVAFLLARKAIRDLRDRIRNSLTKDDLSITKYDKRRG